MLIVFDLDGTLHKSDIVYVKSFQKIFEQLTNKILDETTIKRYIGEKPDKIWKENSDLSLTNINKCISLVSDEMVRIIPNEAVLYDDVINLLESLSTKHDLVLLSNCSKQYLDTITSTFNFTKYFNKIIASEEYNYIPKQEILKELSILPDVVVGDSQSDLNISTSFDISFIYCKYGYGNLNLDGVNNIKELKKKLEI